MKQTRTDLFIEECRAALQGVRTALVELFADARVDSRAPAEFARRLGIHKNLAWKVSRVITAQTPFDSLQHMPGDSGWEIVLNAFSKLVGSAAPVDAVRAALREFDDMTVRHAGDRAHLDLILDSMGLRGGDSQLESSRELYYRGASGLWGVQAKARLMLCVIRPSLARQNADDVAMVGGLLGFQRLRPGVAWRLFRRQLTDDHGNSAATMSLFETLEPPENGAVARTVARQWCSTQMPELEETRHGNMLECILPAGPVGNTGTFDCIVGSITRGLPNTPTPTDQCRSFAATLLLPVNQLIFDVLMHKDIRLTREPEVCVYGFPHGGPDDPTAQREQNLLPITDEFYELPGTPSSLTAPHYPRYSKLVTRVCERLESDPAEYRGMRMVMKYPPMSSKVVARWPLEA